MMVAFLNTMIGFIFWHWIFFSREKDKADDKNEEFDYKSYGKKHWDNLGLSFLGALILFLNADAWWTLAMIQFELDWPDILKNLMYLLSGPFASFLAWLLITLLKYVTSIRIGKNGS